jgi:hypothetical protein
MPFGCRVIAEGKHLGVSYGDEAVQRPWWYEDIEQKREK